jgi:hypothetical protein
LGSTGGIVRVAQVGTDKSKKTKLDVYTPSDPIKTTHERDSLKISENFSEQQNVPKPKRGVTVVMGVMVGLKPTHSNKVSKKKILRVLLDTGSDGDIMFHKKGTNKPFPYLTRQVPKTWHTSNGDFQTKGQGDIQLKFFQYSNSKRVHVQPDIVEYDGTTVEKPEFDLIIGTQTLDELGIILDFKHKMITIDEIELPMQSITDMPRSKSKALALNNSLAVSKEPLSTEQATQRVVRILDASYKKADLQAVVDSCSHL